MISNIKKKYISTIFQICSLMDNLHDRYAMEGVLSRLYTITFFGIWNEKKKWIEYYSGRDIICIYCIIQSIYVKIIIDENFFSSFIYDSIERNVSFTHAHSRSKK